MCNKRGQNPLKGPIFIFFCYGCLYFCAKFGAFITKCTIVILYHLTNMENQYLNMVLLHEEDDNQKIKGTEGTHLLKAHALLMWCASFGLQPCKMWSRQAGR